MENNEEKKVRERTTISLSRKTKSQLTKIKGGLEQKTGTEHSMDYLIQYLIGCHHRGEESQE
jgi:hypothetical protein